MVVAQMQRQPLRRDAEAQHAFALHRPAERLQQAKMGHRLLDDRKAGTALQRHRRSVERRFLFLFERVDRFDPERLDEQRELPLILLRLADLGELELDEVLAAAQQEPPLRGAGALEAGSAERDTTRRLAVDV